jgi:spermidine synthase
VVLEPDVELVALVRERLPLPARSGIRIRPVDGRSGLAALREASADLVVLDAFAGGRIPADLVTRELFADVRRVLAADGRLAANLVDRAPFPHARRVVAAIRAELAEVLVAAEPATLRGRRQGNLVVVAGSTVPTAELTGRASSGAAPYRVLDARAVSDSLGGGRPFTDRDSAAGPIPARA